MIEVRFLFSAESLRNLCIKNRLYTCGDCRAYQRLLGGMCGVAKPEELEICLSAIVDDIIEHSSADFKDPEYAGILASEIMRNCVTSMII